MKQAILFHSSVPLHRLVILCKSISHSLVNERFKLNLDAIIKITPPTA
jgi:hypothetical protein